MKTTNILCSLMCLMWFSSCLTVNRIQRNCDKFAQICVTDKKTEIHYRDTTIYVEKPIYVDKIIEVPIPGYKDSLIIRDSVRIIDGYAEMRSIHKEQGIIGVEASVYRSEFLVNVFLLDSTILYNYIDTLVFADSLRIYNAIREKTTEDTVVIQKKYIPGFYKFTFWIFIIIIVGAVGYFAWIRFFRKLAGKYL